MQNNSFNIYGIHSIEEAIKNNFSKIEKIYFDEYVINKRNNDKLTAILHEVKKLKIPYSVVDRKKLDLMASDNKEVNNHQGVVAIIRSFDYVDLEQFLKDIKDIQNPCVLILDNIEDTHNVGAMIRSAVAANIAGIIIHKYSGAPINGTVYKTSAGLVENIPIIKVSNINATIEKLKDNKYAKFWIYGLDMSGKKSLWDIEYNTPTAFIIGNEERGISLKTGEHCDELIYIPMNKKAESLNASVSAALVSYEWARQNKDIFNK